MTKSRKTTSVAVVGAGPTGLAAAAQLSAKGMTPIVFEKGTHAGSAIAKWGHVRVFTPWRHMIDRAVVALLEPTGWKQPDLEHLPTGREIVEEYLIPAANALGEGIQFGATVTAITKRGLSKSSSDGRRDVPYVVHYKTADEQDQVLEVDAVIDASGTWSLPNPVGADGVPVPGESKFAPAIAYGIPDVSGAEMERYAGQRTLLLGSGHSAANVALDILKLKSKHQNTQLYWGLRGRSVDRLLGGGGLNDALPARGAVGIAAKQAVDAGALELLAPVRVERIDAAERGLTVQVVVDGFSRSIEVDRVVVATGFRPDLEILRELRIDLDEVVEAPRALAPMIDPNVHSCGTVPLHGVNELSHPDEGFFVVGMKSYGRAPTFLMKTGYEQVRSVTDYLAGDYKAARRVELVRPKIGAVAGASGAACSA